TLAGASRPVPGRSSWPSMPQGWPSFRWGRSPCGRRSARRTRPASSSPPSSPPSRPRRRPSWWRSSSRTVPGSGPSATRPSLCRRLPPHPRAPRAPAAAARAPAEKLAEVRPPVSPGRRAFALGLLVLFAAAAARAAVQLRPGHTGFELVRTFMSEWLLPALMLLILLFGLARRVKVYEVFVTAAKEGFQIAIVIIPF